MSTNKGNRCAAPTQLHDQKTAEKKIIRWLAQVLVSASWVLTAVAQVQPAPKDQQPAHHLPGQAASPGSTQQVGPPQAVQPEQQMEMPQQMEQMERRKVEPLPPPVIPRLGVLKAGPGQPVITLEELEQMAQKSNPTLAQAASEVRAATGRRLQSGLWPNPTVGYTGKEIRGGALGGGQQGFFVEQSVILGGKLGLNRKIFDHEIRQAEAEAEEQRFRVMNNVHILYFRALAAQEMVEMRRHLAQVARESAKYQRGLFNIGQQNETEVLKAEVEADEAELAVISAEHMRRRITTDLAAVAGNPAIGNAMVMGNLEDNLSELDEERFLQSLLNESPAVRISQAGVARAEASLARARREPVPDLVLRGGLQQNLERLEPTGRSVGLQGFAEVGVQLRLFNRNQGSIRAAEAEQERARLEVTRTELALRGRAAFFLENYRTARAIAERYRARMQPRAQRAYELIYQRYGLLQASYPQVLMTQRMMLELQTEYITALEKVQANAVALRGFLLTDGLEAPARPQDLDRPVREINVPSMGTMAAEER